MRKAWQYVLGAAVICIAVLICASFVSRVPDQYQSKMTVCIEDGYDGDVFYQDMFPDALVEHVNLDMTYRAMISSGKLQDILAENGISSKYTLEVNTIIKAEEYEIVIKAADAQTAYDVCSACALVLPQFMEGILDSIHVEIVDNPSFSYVPVKSAGDL